MPLIESQQWLMLGHDDEQLSIDVDQYWTSVVAWRMKVVPLSRKV